ncbi:hypothetical protein VTP01DRAFT_8976 [Rhizomucor pusillus]|uniref:uncharacterized protein n=1 Tax=Rhizomucor pusillus TaxID=4840 RepID=UPI003741F879
MLLRTTQQSLLGELKVNGVDQHFQLLEFTSIDHLQCNALPKAALRFSLLRDHRLSTVISKGDTGQTIPSCNGCYIDVSQDSSTTVQLSTVRIGFVVDDLRFCTAAYQTTTLLLAVYKYHRRHLRQSASLGKVLMLLLI